MENENTKNQVIQEINKNCKKSNKKQFKSKLNNSGVLKIDVDACCIDNCEICCLENYLDKQWMDLLYDEFNTDYFRNIKHNLHNSDLFYPPAQLIFNFCKLTPFRCIRVVIIGQDPYHNPGQAMGLSFSVPRGIKIPPSLRNIYKELSTDISGFIPPVHGDLTHWAEQGVLLLNDTLTVSKNLPGSHSKWGWSIFTDKIISLINTKLNNVVFILWGENASKKAKNIDSTRHLILKCGHPSPLSIKRFIGCKHFSQTNEYLKKNGIDEIDWCFPE